MSAGGEGASSAEGEASCGAANTAGEDVEATLRKHAEGLREAARVTAAAVKAAECAEREAKQRAKRELRTKRDAVSDAKKLNESTAKAADAAEDAARKAATANANKKRKAPESEKGQRAARKAARDGQPAPPEVKPDPETPSPALAAATVFAEWMQYNPIFDDREGGAWQEHHKISKEKAEAFVREKKNSFFCCEETDEGNHKGMWFFFGSKGAPVMARSWKQSWQRHRNWNTNGDGLVMEGTRRGNK